MQNNLVKERINEFFKKDTDFNKEILTQLTLYVYSLEETNETDLYILAKIIPEEYLSKLINYCDGNPIKLPSKEEYRKKYLLVVCFYLKEVLNYDWKEIKEILNIPENDQEILSSISIGHQISKIKESLNRDLKNILKEDISVEEFNKMIERVKL